MNQKVYISVVTIFFTILTVVITYILLFHSNQAEAIYLIADTNFHVADVKDEYTQLKAQNFDIPRYFNPCGDSALRISNDKEATIETTVDINRFNIFRNNDNLILIGVTCDTERKDIPADNLLVAIYDVQTLEEIDSQILEEQITDFKTKTNQNDFLEIVTLGIGSANYEIHFTEDILIFDTEKVDSAEYLSIESNYEYIPTEAVSVTAENGIVLNPKIGQLEINISEIEKIN